jgi:hypothetical protein
MKEDWILDVLADLRTFAGKNGLRASERQIDQAMVAVANELTSCRIAQRTAQRDMSNAGTIFGSTAGNQNPQ